MESVRDVRDAEHVFVTQSTLSFLSNENIEKYGLNVCLKSGSVAIPVSLKLKLSNFQMLTWGASKKNKK